ncbi:MAG: flagellin [Thermoplasmata archaeon]|mgnify:CR=1 FL=1|nr:flagellin [Thermoplasmata archaeon]
MDRLIGRYCKIVLREPGKERASVVSGILEDIDYDAGFVIIDSDRGLGCLNMKSIIAIKPKSLRKVKKEFAQDERGFVGIGTLIVFIAMILVAAVAASVLIRTGELLQQRANKVGLQTTREISSGLTIVDVIGYTNSEKTYLTHIALTVRPRSGSEDIDLRNTVLHLMYDKLIVLSFPVNASAYVAPKVSPDGVFSTLTTPLNGTTYGIIALHDVDNSIYINGGMNVGDKAIIMVNLSAAFNSTGIPPRASISGSLVPEVGAPGTFDVSVPCVFTSRIVELN